MSRVALALLLAAPRAVAITSSAVTGSCRDNNCCGMPETVVRREPSEYDFVKPTCEDAGPQSPRDLMDGAEGLKTAKQATLNAAQAAFLNCCWLAAFLQCCWQLRRMSRVAVAALALLLAAPRTAAVTCGAVKDWYRDNNCCGMPDKVVRRGPSGYDFVKPACENAEPQSPRDLTDGAEGLKTPKQATLNAAQAAFLPLVNVHYHLGAEHKSEAYQDQTDSDAYDSGRHLAHGHGEKGVRPGYMCAAVPMANEVNYTFQHCLGEVEVGKSYEVHYVHSSAGYTPDELEDADVDGIEDGLGGAANGRGILNPMIVVQGQIYQIVPAEYGGITDDDLLHGWTVTDHTNAVMYPGSTTGTSHNNEICSPYHITWHVDKLCHKVTPESFDNLCRQMKELYDMEFDLYPHGSRQIVDKKYVCSADYVTQYA